MVAAQKACDLLYPAFLIQCADGGMGFLLTDLLINTISSLTRSRDLGQMCDHQKLSGLCQLLQQLPDLLGGDPADPHIDLIENKRRRIRRIRKSRLQRQHHPGKLTAGCNLMQRLCFLPEIRRQHEYRFIPSVCLDLIPFTEFRIKLHMREIHSLQGFFHLPDQWAGRFLSQLRQL